MKESRQPGSPQRPSLPRFSPGVWKKIQVGGIFVFFGTLFGLIQDVPAGIRDVLNWTGFGQESVDSSLPPQDSIVQQFEASGDVDEPDPGQPSEAAEGSGIIVPMETSEEEPKNTPSLVRRRQSQPPDSDGSLSSGQGELISRKPTSASQRLPQVAAGHIRASGVGYAPSNVNEPGRRYSLAKRTAEVVAQRNLAEKIQGALLESRTTIRDSALVTEEIELRTSALIRGARVVNERELTDGGVEVVLECSIDDIAGQDRSAR